MTQRAVVFAIACLTLAACATAVAPAPPSTSAAPRATASVAIATPAVNAAPGRCTNPQMTTQAVILRYFELSTSKDPGAVSDCFAASWRARFARNPSWDEAAIQWASAGPATGVQITSADTVNGCDRYGVAAQMATYGTNNAFSVPPFFTVGSEGGTPRIYETTTALVSAANATTICK